MTETASRVICLTCRHWLPRATPEHARIGFARCDLTHWESALFIAESGTCAEHSASDHDTLAKRLVWLDRIRASAHEEAA